MQGRRRRAERKERLTTIQSFGAPILKTLISLLILLGDRPKCTKSTIVGIVQPFPFHRTEILYRKLLNRGKTSNPPYRKSSQSIFQVSPVKREQLLVKPSGDGRETNRD
jgi:hypothetical protein